MGPKGKYPLIDDLFQQSPAELISLKLPLVTLSKLIDWLVFEKFGNQLQLAISVS